MATTAIALRKPSNGAAIELLGATQTDSELLHAVPTDRDLKLVITVPRNLKFHKKFFAMLGVIYDYMDDDTRLRLNIWNTEELLNRLKIDLGLYTVFIIGAGSTLPEGTVVYKPMSISFDKMEDLEFGKLYKATIGVAIGKYTTAQTEESMMRAVDAVLRFE